MTVFSIVVFVVLAGMAASELRGLSASQIERRAPRARSARCPEARPAWSCTLAACTACA